MEDFKVEHQPDVLFRSLFTEDFIGHLSYFLSQEVVNHTQILHLEFRNQGLLVTTTLSE
jgi:hypothetical protein